MLNSMYPVYFEVKLCSDAKEHEEGGFIYAHNFVEAMKTIEEAYCDEMISCHIELFDNFSLCLPVKKARLIKEIVNEI